MQTLRPATRLVAALGAGVVLLTACGQDGDVADQDLPTTVDDGQGIAVGEPNPNAPGDGGAAGGTRPADQEFLPAERARMLLGSDQEQVDNLAIEFGWTVRTGRIDDESFALTEDYVIDRITVEYDTNDDGVAVVTKVTIELEGGPEVFEA